MTLAFQVPVQFQVPSMEIASASISALQLSISLKLNISYYSDLFRRTLPLLLQWLYVRLRSFRYNANPLIPEPPKLPLEYKLATKN